MARLYQATDDGPRVVSRQAEGWRGVKSLDVGSASCITADPARPERVFCGTVGQGVWRSDDAGVKWRRVFEELPHERITSLAVSPNERIGADGAGVVYVGTEPSAVFRSEDGGDTWRECDGLTDLPSADTWSFPPRPQTHHVRWIEPDPHVPGRVYVAIEAGALVSTPDGGHTWHDRVPDGPRDTHRLVTHPQAPGRMWSAAGDGFFESDDAGQSWRRSEEGLRFRYCWSVAVHPSDPTIAVLSAAPGPRQAHTREQAESAVYRRTGDGPWEEVRAGLPASKGTRAPVVAADSNKPGVFYCAAEADLYRSVDQGASWQRLDVAWPDDPRDWRCHALFVVGNT